ncbi:MAG: heparan-alpha-glucosaminide N-acetyltransferase domain-containing protein [Myxococcaceae bacterium]
MSVTSGRVRAFDWLRGLAVPFMLQCHALSLLLRPLHQTPTTKALLWLDGLVAPSFMLAAGFALALTQVRSAHAGNQTARRLKSLRRIGEVLAVATLVNWMWFPIFREPKWLFRVDILHCIGLSLLLTFPVVTLLAKRPRVLVPVALGIAGVIFAIAPFGEQVNGAWAMLANKSTGAVFPLLPWTGYVFLGAAFGAIAAIRDPVALAKRLALLGGVAGAVWMAAPLLREVYPPHDFGTFNPAEHARRLTVIALVLLTLLHIDHRMPALAGTVPFKVLNVFGTNSLAAYFFHEALLYYPVFGFSFQAQWGYQSGWGQYAVLTLALIAVTFGLCWITDRVYRGVGELRTRTSPAHDAVRLHPG